MNREIEFRAWLKKEYYSVLNPENKIYRVENLDFDKNEAYLSECGWYDFDDIELMQYTGLKDKNGVKIFEGDVVKSIYGEIYDVFFASGGFMLSNFENEFNITDSHTSKLEVIGNIYENKELLND